MAYLVQSSVIFRQTNVPGLKRHILCEISTCLSVAFSMSDLAFLDVLCGQRATKEKGAY